MARVPQREQFGVGCQVITAPLAACTTGAIPAGADLDRNLGLTMMGISELGDEQKEELQKLQEHLKQIRRKRVKFIVVPVVGGASGAEYATPQLQSVWEKLSWKCMFSALRINLRHNVAVIGVGDKVCHMSDHLHVV